MFTIKVAISFSYSLLMLRVYRLSQAETMCGEGERKGGRKGGREGGREEGRKEGIHTYIHTYIQYIHTYVTMTTQIS